MSKKAKIGIAQISGAGQPGQRFSGQVVFPTHTSWPIYKGPVQTDGSDSRPVLRVDLSQLSTDWLQDLTKHPELGDNTKKEKREPDLKPPLKPYVITEEEKIEAVIDFFKSASPKSATKSLKEIGPEAINTLFRLAFEASTLPWSEASGTEPATSRPADAPPLWAQRGDDCEVSVIEWVKKYHGHLVGDFDEERGRQNRDALAKADPELARAYSSTVRSNKRNLLPGLPLLPRHATADPAEALKRRQETNREAAARYRENKRISMMR